MRFSYKIFDFHKNKQITGIIESENEENLIKYFKNKNFLIIDIKPVLSFSDQIKNFFFSHISFNDIVNFTRQIAIMVNAGLNVIDSLEILKKQTTKKSLLSLINQIVEDIKAGVNFSDALKKNNKIFNNLYTSLIKAGEKSGKLDEILMNLANDLEKKREFNSKIKSALAYPVIIIITMVIVIFIMFTFIIPQLLSMFKEMNLELPLTTRIIMSISFFFQKNWFLIILVCLIFFIYFQRWRKTEKGRYFIDKMLINFPAFSQLIRMANLVNSTRTLAILTKAGVSILESLDIVTETTSNIMFKNSFKNIYQKVEKGESLGRAFGSEEIFPPILIQMVEVGEETGRLDETLERIANYFEMESETTIKMIMTLIEPMILVVLGLGVGFLVMSVISPIYQLTGSIK